MLCAKVFGAGESMWRRYVTSEYIEPHVIYIYTGGRRPLGVEEARMAVLRMFSTGYGPEESRGLVDLLGVYAALVECRYGGLRDVALFWKGVCCDGPSGQSSTN